MTKFVSNIHVFSKGWLGDVEGYLHIEHPERETEPMPKGNPDTLRFSDMFPNYVSKLQNNYKIGKRANKISSEELASIAKQIKELLAMNLSLNKISGLIKRGRDTVYRVMDEFNLWENRRDYYLRLQDNLINKFEKIAQLMIEQDKGLTTAIHIYNLHPTKKNVDDLKNWLLKEKGMNWQNYGRNKKATS